MRLLIFGMKIAQGRNKNMRRLCLIFNLTFSFFRIKSSLQSFHNTMIKGWVFSKPLSVNLLWETKRIATISSHKRLFNLEFINFKAVFESKNLWGLVYRNRFSFFVRNKNHWILRLFTWEAKLADWKVLQMWVHRSRWFEIHQLIKYQTLGSDSADEIIFYMINSLLYNCVIDYVVSFGVEMFNS